MKPMHHGASLRSAEPAGHLSQPVWILGSGRCGSTMVFEQLRRHPNAGMTSEARVLDFLVFCADFARTPAHELRTFPLHREIELSGIVHPTYAEQFAELFDQSARELVERFYHETFSDPAYTHWGDKLPGGRAAQAAQSAWPNSRYVIIVRDPRDTFVSLARFGRLPHVVEVNPHLRDPDPVEFAVYWRNFYRTAHQDLEHTLTLRYEDWIADPRRELRRTLDFLDLDPDALGPPLDDGTDFDLHGTSRSPGASVARARRELDAATRRKIEAEVGEVMAEFGYRDSPN